MRGDPAANGTLVGRRPAGAGVGAWRYYGLATRTPQNVRRLEEGKLPNFRAIRQSRILATSHVLSDTQPLDYEETVRQKISSCRESSAGRRARLLFHRRGWRGSRAQPRHAQTLSVKNEDFKKAHNALCCTWSQRNSG